MLRSLLRNGYAIFLRQERTGRCYDTETSLYYLQSRYYDPAVGRFISPDDASYLGANGDLLSYNLYAYCSNNSVNYSDPSGHSFLTSLFIIGAIVVFSALDGGITAYQAGQDFWKGFAAGAFGGLIGGTLTILFPEASLLGKVGIRGLSSFVYGTLNEWFQTGTISNDAWVMIRMDVTFDMLLSIYYVDSLPLPHFSDKILQNAASVIIGSAVDSSIDILQTGLIYAPVMQNQANNGANNSANIRCNFHGNKQLFAPTYI